MPQGKERNKIDLRGDYSLHNMASRAAKLDDKLVVTDFAKTITRGSVGEPDIAVCVLPALSDACERPGCRSECAVQLVTSVP